MDGSACGLDHEGGMEGGRSLLGKAHKITYPPKSEMKDDLYVRVNGFCMNNIKFECSTCILYYCAASCKLKNIAFTSAGLKKWSCSIFLFIVIFVTHLRGPSSEREAIMPCDIKSSFKPVYRSII